MRYTYVIVRENHIFIKYLNQYAQVAQQHQIKIHATLFITLFLCISIIKNSSTLIRIIAQTYNRIFTYRKFEMYLLTSHSFICVDFACVLFVGNIFNIATNNR